MKKILGLGPLFVIIASVLWSLDGLLRVSLYVLPPLVVVFYEHLIGFLLLVPLLVRKWPYIPKITPKTWGAFIWITALSSIAGTVLYTAALGKIQYTQFSVVVLLQQLEPIVVLIFASIFLRERVKPSAIPWILVAMVGAYFVSFPDLRVNLTTGAGTAMAALMAVGAAFAWGSSTVFSRYALLQLPVLVTTGMRFGLAALLGFILIQLTGLGSAMTSISSEQLLTLVVIAFTTGMVALYIYYYGLKRTPAWVTTICELTWPLSAIVIDYVYFHKPLTVTQWIGALGLMLSIYQVSRRRHMPAT